MLKVISFTGMFVLNLAAMALAQTASIQVDHPCGARLNGPYRCPIHDHCE
jgi:hypothetical protein